ncbi:MAG TPA: ABC transporter permease [Bryobacteraceae bacterium]|nr:ABC transporter permease [Bryobacteraceae bacterium]
MDFLWADVRQSVRMMRNNLAFTTVSVAALALGIGANTGIFSVVNKVLLQPLPYPQPDRIMRIGRQFPGGNVGTSTSIPKYEAWRRNTVFSSMALYDQEGPGLNLSTSDRPEQIKGVHISADYFKVFLSPPMLGRSFTASEDSPNGPKAVIISEKLWRTRFGSDPAILSRSITLNSETYPVVGIASAKFVAEPPADVWIALQADPNSTNQGHYLAVAGRLKPGATLEQARAAMKLAGEGFRRAYPKWMDKTENVAVRPLGDSIVENVRPALLILLGAVGLVLLIACANVANLLLARAASRQKELAIRAAIGASRWRVIRQLLTESVMLAGMGGLLGFLLGIWGVRALLTMVPGDIPRLNDPSQWQSVFAILDWRIAAFTIAISFLTGILFGLFPALQISNPDLSSTLKEASGRSVTGRGQNRVRKLLVSAEMALALVLLASAALLIRTFVGLSTANVGVDPHHVLTMQTSLAGQRYATTGKVETFSTQVLRRIEGIPGVEAAAIAIQLPTRGGIDLPFDIAGRAHKAGDNYNGEEQWRSISANYFSVFKIPVLSGRVFSQRDTGNSARVVLINYAMAQKYWPKENPVGQVIVIGKGLGPQFDDLPRQIIGIVGNVRETGVGDKAGGVMYIPVNQQPEGLTQLANSVIPFSWCVRSKLDTKALAAAAVREIQAVDGQMPLSNVRTMAQVLAEGTARQNFNMLLLSIFAGIALVLAAIGIYGLMSYSVQQQTPEFGIRMALGAGKQDLLRLIIKQGMTPALFGVAAGLAIAFGVTRLLASLLYGIKPYDPLSFAVVALTLSVVALFATYLPARKVGRTNPTALLSK